MSEYASTSSRPTSPVGDLPQIPGTSRPYRFNWDAAYRKPGPGSISETTEGRGEYFAAASQTPYDSFTQTATHLALSTFPPEWSSSTHGFHAISTVVNSPHKKSAPPKAHSALPTVPPADLPRVRRKDFDAYLRSVAPEWERFEKNAEQGREGVAQISTQASQNGRSSSSIELPTTPRTPRPAFSKPLPALESVPEVFFEKNFNLGDPRTFNLVTEFSDQHGGFLLDDPASFSYAQPLIDKLSGHADTIEQHLVREISVRSTSFFAALSNLQDLQTESEQCLGRIKQLRGLLKEVDEKSAVRGLEVVKLEGRLRNLGRVRQAVGVVGSVMEMVGVARGLVGAGQWGEALNVIDGLSGLWNTDIQQPVPTKETPSVSLPSRDGRRSPLPTVAESPPPSPPPTQQTSLVNRTPVASIPISPLQAFASLPSNLRALTMQIASSLTSEIVGVLKLDLIDRVDHGPSILNDLPDLKGHIDSPEIDGGMQLSLKDKLRPLLHSLVRTGAVRQATAAWREVVLVEVGGVLKRHIPVFSLDDDDSAPKSEITGMEQPAFFNLARSMYDYLLNCVVGLHAQNAIIIEVLEGIRQSKPLDIVSLKEDLADILASASELANARAAKVIGCRAEQHTALDLKDFWLFFNMSWDFVVKTEVVCRRMIVGLRGVIVSQSKSFIQAFHQSRLSQSAKLVEDEQWSPAEVPPLTQHAVNLLVEASIRDPPEFLFNPPLPSSLASPKSSTLSSTLSPAFPNTEMNGNGLQPSSPVPSPSLPPGTSRLQSPDGPPRRRSMQNTPSKHLKIEDRNFFAVSATLEVLVLLSDYLLVIVNLNLPMLVTETMSRIIELLKAFNSRTCQVVLGAGAMRSAGLKNITAKHLALASQSLSIMISLIPYVRETFRRHLNAKQAVMLVEFDKLKRDYQEHQNEIHAKLIAIMGDRLSAHIRTLQTVKWDVPKPGGGANEYMELLAKETTTLHKVLSRYLSVSVVEYVMTQVFAAINHRLSEEFALIELPSLEAKERLLADARFLHEKLSGLKNVRAPTAMLEIVVQEKRVMAVQSPSPQQSAQSPSLQSAIPQSHSSTSRFAHMFSRATSVRATTPVPASEPESEVVKPSEPTPDMEKVLPILSPSPEPSSKVPTPTPSVAVKPSALMNGHAAPPLTATPESSQVENDVTIKASPDREPVETALAADSESLEATVSGEKPVSPAMPPPTPPKDVLVPGVGAERVDADAEKTLPNSIKEDATSSEPGTTLDEQRIDGAGEEPKMNADATV